MLRFLTDSRLLSPLEGDGGEGGGGGDAAPSISPFEQAMRNVGAEAEAQLRANGQDQPPADPAAATPPAGAPPPVQPAGGTPGAVPAAAAAAPAPQYLTLEQGHAIVAQWQHTQQQLAALTQMMARGAAPPAQPAAPAPPALSRPSTLELVKTFREPMRNAGESDAAFEQRRTGMLLDHFNHGSLEYAEKYAEQQMEKRFERYQAEQVALQQRAEGERRYGFALTDAVTKGGFAAGTPVAQYVQQIAHNAIVARVNQGERFNDASLTAAMTQEVARAKQYFAAPAAPVAPAPAAPAPGQPLVATGQPRGDDGKFIPKPAAPAAAAPAAPPISGAGGTGAQTPPPNGGTEKATTFEGAMRQVHARAQREMGQA